MTSAFAGICRRVGFGSAARFVFVYLTLLAALAAGQEIQPAPTPDAVFSSARTRLLADINRQLRYTCVQNITRQMYRAIPAAQQSCSTLIAAFETRKHDPPLSSWDRLRLDVAIADNQEIHSWPGAPRFSDDEVRRFLGPGVFGTGDFGMFLTGIFGGSATLKFQGERVIAGRTLFDYTYEVAQRASGYHADRGSSSVITAYGGSFSLDPQTSDLVELTVRTAELPASTGMCQARSQIQYARMDIHGRQVLVPRETNLRIIGADGKEGTNTITYSGCREYGSKSVLRFDDLEQGAVSVTPSAVRNPPSGEFPAGLAFDCRIVTPIDSDSAASGSEIEGVLRSPIRGKNKAILAPRGARIRGRLVRFVDHESPLGYFELGVRLESVEVNGVELPLYAARQIQAQPPAPAPEWFQAADLTELPTPAPPNVGIFFFSQAHLQLRQLDSAWITTSPEASKQDQDARAARKQKQILEREVFEKFALAMNDSQQATDLLNATPHENPADYPNLAEILAYDREAIQMGESTDTNVLNDLYPSLGDRFKYDFLEGRTLFIHGWETQSNDDLRRSNFLNNEWTDWYGAHRKEIGDAIKLRELDSD